MTASATGTATGLEDLFTDIVNFLTKDTDLVSASEKWTVMRQERDNLAGVAHNLTEQTSAQARKIVHGCRYDPRSINCDATNSTDGYVQCTGFSAGVSYIRFKLRTATRIDKVIIGAPAGGSRVLNGVPRDFKLQYSDNDSSWTTALTVSSGTAYTFNEYREHSVGGSPGSHLYWRIVVDSITSSTALYWKSMLLLDASGNVANHFGSEVIFKAPGSSGTDEIYTGIRSEYDVAQGWYNLVLNGYTGFDSDELSWFEQPGALPGFGMPVQAVNPMVPCWDTNMNYWFAASGRSFRFGVKVSTSFEGGYLGFILPYATPSQYPYPLAIGGSLMPTANARGQEWRYSYNYYKHSVFTTPAGDRSSSELDTATLYIRAPEGQWRHVCQRITSSDPDIISDMQVSDISPFRFTGPATVLYPTGVYSSSTVANSLPYRELLNGGYVLQPTIIITSIPSPFVFGELEGVFIISGFNNAAENTTVFNSVNYIIFQNVARTEVHEFWALALP